MAHHLTPAELADRLQMERQEVIGKCVELGVPIFHGRIDRNLFECSLRDRERRRAATPPSGGARRGRPPASGPV